MPRWYPGNEERIVRFIDLRVPLALFSTWRSINENSAVFVGLYHQETGDVQTPQNKLRVRMIKPPPGRRSPGQRSDRVS